MPRRKASPYYSDEDEETDSHARKRSRMDQNAVEERLESLITRVGRKGLQSIESNVEGLTSVLQVDIPNYKEKILRILVKCAWDIPERMTIYTTVIGLLNATNYSVGGEFVEMLVRQLKEFLKSHEFTNAKRIVRFLADLVNCYVVNPSSLLNLFENFVEVTLDDNIPQVRADWYVYAVLYALPWVGKTLAEKEETGLSHVLASIEGYLRKRVKTYLDGLRVWDSDEPHPQEDYLDCLWAQICNLKNQNWLEKVTWRLHLSFASVLEEGKSHKLPQVIPPTHDDDSEYPLPSVVFRMFDYTDVVTEEVGSTLPGSHAIERFLVEDQLNIIIDANYLDRKACSKEMVELPRRVKLPIEYMIVETVFSQMLRLPRSPYIQLAYGSLFIELCRELPETMPQVLAQGMEILYERLNHMKGFCIERLADWFSYHLSNYKFQWGWNDWMEAVKMEKIKPQPKFIAETLQKLMRFSYYDYIERIVPTEFAPLLPKTPGPINKYSAEAPTKRAGSAIAQLLTQEIKSKCTTAEALNLIKELSSVSEDGDLGLAPGVTSIEIDVFFSVLFNVGSKTFSHAFALIDKFSTLIRTLVGDKMAHKVEVLQVLHSVWQEQRQMVVVLADKLLKEEIVDAEAVARWIYSPEMERKLIDFYVWEILHTTLDRVGSRVNRLTKDVDEARDEWEARQARMRECEDDLDNMTSGELTRLEERKTEALRSQCGVFMLILLRHVRPLQAHLEKRDATATDDTWYRWMVDRMRQIMFEHHDQLQRYTENIKSSVFTKDVHENLRKIFDEFSALHS